MTLFTCSACPKHSRTTSLLGVSDLKAIELGWVLSEDGTADTCPDCSKAAPGGALTEKLARIEALVAAQAAEIAGLRAAVDALCDKIAAPQGEPVAAPAAAATSPARELPKGCCSGGDCTTGPLGPPGLPGQSAAAPRKLPQGCGKSIEVWLPGGGRALRACGRHNFGSLVFCDSCRKLP